MGRRSEAVVLYSGGTDSTCAAAIMAGEFDRIHLLTFKRFGFSCVENASRNVGLLKKKFATVIFKHEFIDVDRLLRYIGYSRFFQDIFKYGYFTLSNCVFCCLAGHFRALYYCLDNKISDIADGVTREWSFFPSHMEKAILLFRQMYSEFGIKYYTPVYDFDVPEPARFIDKLSPGRTLPKDNIDYPKNTTGNYLYKLGILPSVNVKGTALDHNMQPICFQFILHHIFIYWYYMATHDYRDFELLTLRFLKEKIDIFVKVTKESPLRLKKIIE